MRTIALLIAGLAFCWAESSTATIVTVDVGAGSESGFQFPRVHTADTHSITLETEFGATTFFRRGVGPSMTVVDPITADVTPTSIRFLGGALRLADGTSMPDLEITGGEVSFEGVPTDRFAGSIETSSYGTFFVLNRNWAPTHEFPPNHYDPFGIRHSRGVLAVWGNNWNAGDGPSDGRAWGLDLVLSFDPIDGTGPPDPVIPEPSSALLLGIGLLGLTRLRRPSTAFPRSQR